MEMEYTNCIIGLSHTEKLTRFWSFLKSTEQDSVGVALLKSKTGFLKSDSQSRAKILDEQFCTPRKMAALFTVVTLIK